MAEIKFPRRHGDQSFTVFARFSTSDHAILALVRDYVKAWIRANSTWTRIWRSDVIREERLDFYSEFLSEPRVEEGPGESSFSVVLEGRPSATRWKDWAVFLVGDISTVFPEVQFERFES
jgi:hypothetical protein